MQVGVFRPSLQDPSLRLMVPHLLDILLESCAATTAQKCSSGWQRWKAWARSKLGVSVLPAVSSQVALYLTELVEHAVRNGHSVSVSDGVTVLVKGVVEGAQRKLARPVQPKQPLAHDTIASITFSLNSASAFSVELRFLFILLVGYADVFRISEVLSIRVKDVSILEDFTSVYLVKQKRIGGANDSGFRSLDSALKDRHVGWKNPKSKFRYIGTVPEELIGITPFMSI